MNLNDFLVFDGEKFQILYKNKACYKICLNSWDVRNNQYKLGLSSFQENILSIEVDINKINNFF
ncbi:hypothetical protein LJB96_02905 [Methanobrevibacter sp. OttesenSCG-928-K11]|nr:hypothetical protein [Methanobrevibacter sp. OttesenSCG-928-K11]